MYLTYTIYSKNHKTTKVAYFMYLAYIISSKYHNTIKVAFCVPYLHNMLQKS